MYCVITYNNNNPIYRRKLVLGYGPNWTQITIKPRKWGCLLGICFVFWLNQIGPLGISQ